MKPLNDYSWVRGVNYYQCGEEQLRRELGYGKRVNLNAVRIWLDRVWYERNPEAYLKNLVDYVRICYDCGYQVMPILFNGNFLDPETLTCPACGEKFACIVEEDDLAKLDGADEE